MVSSKYYKFISMYVPLCFYVCNVTLECVKWKKKSLHDNPAAH